MSFIEKLNFVKSNAVFADGRKMLEAKLSGHFKRDQLLDGINDFANEFNDKNVQIGIAAHYKNIKKWSPALISSSNQKISLWDCSDSPETAEAYRNDSIDYIHVFVIENKNYNNKVTHLRGNHN